MASSGHCAWNALVLRSAEVVAPPRPHREWLAVLLPTDVYLNWHSRFEVLAAEMAAPGPKHLRQLRSLDLGGTWQHRGHAHSVGGAVRDWA